MLGNQRIVFELGIGDFGARLKDRVARIGNQNGVTRIEQGQAQMAHALLRAIARLHHGRRNARNTKATLIVIAHGLLELGQVAQGILPHLGIWAACVSASTTWSYGLKSGVPTLML